MIAEHQTGQLKGPFQARQELIRQMVNDYNSSVDSVIQIGIQADPGTKFFINGDLYEVGNTGLYEQMNTRIKSVYFDKNTDDKVYIEYIMVGY